MAGKRLLIGLTIGLVLIGIPVAIYIYLDDSQSPSQPVSDSVSLKHPVVDWVWSGAVTTNSATVKARLPATVEARLAVQASPELNTPHYVVPTRTAAEDGIAVFALNELEPDVRPDATKGPQIVSLLSAPLKAHQRVLGVITLGRTSEDAMFTAGDLKLLMALASQAGVAIANAREVEARERRLKQRIAELHIVIDEAKKQREVTAITDSEYFDRLREDARKMRAEFDV